MKKILIFSFLLSWMIARYAYAIPPFPPQAAGSGSMATDTIWDAAGDTVYGTGADTSGRLAIGTAYQLWMVNAGATAPAWTSTLGATGNRLTAGFFLDLTVTNAIAGSVTGNAGTATALAADPADCAAGQVATGIAASGALTCSATAGAAALLTGYSSGAGTVAGTDTVLQAINKLNGNIALKTAGPGTVTDAVPVCFDGTTGYVLKACTAINISTLNLPSANADPSTTAGNVVHDTTVTGLLRGAVKWFDGTGVRILVDLDVAPSDDDYVVAYDADNDKFYMKADANSGSATSITDIADATADGTISTAAYEITITGAMDEANHSILTIVNTDADRAADTTILTLKDNDGADANAFYLKLIGDADGTPTTDLSISQTAVTSGALAWVLSAGTLGLPTGTGDVTATAGYIAHDNNDTQGSAGGNLEWYDGTNVRWLLDIAASGSADYTVIAKEEYFPIRYGEADDSVTAPGDAAEINTSSTMIGRSFVEDADNGLVFWWKVPNDYVGGIKYRVYYAIQTDAGADETVAFALSGCSVGDTDAIACSEGTAVNVTDELGTDNDAGELLISGYSAEVTVTNITAGEMVKLLFIRDVSEDDYDDADDNVLVTGIEVKYKARINGIDTY